MSLNPFEAPYRQTAGAERRVIRALPPVNVPRQASSLFLLR